MNRKVHEVGPRLCPECGGKMKIIAFLTRLIVARIFFSFSAAWF
jgi:hypothetical protein